MELENIRNKFNETVDDIFSEIYYSTIFNNIPSAIVLFDSEENILEANDTFYISMGYPKSSKIIWKDIVYKEDYNLSKKYMEQYSVSPSGVVVIPKRYFTSNGEIKYCLTSITSVYYEKINKIATLLDLSKNKEHWFYLHAEFRKQIN